MTRFRFKTVLVTITAMIVATMGAFAQDYTSDEYVRDDIYSDDLRIDRYLDVDVWTNHNDGEYYVGDNVVISFRTNRDAFVVLYSVDTRGRVNMIFPSEPGGNNFIRGGVTYQLPGGNDDFDLVVTGPGGVENIQAIASREKFTIPDWYPVSGLVCDWDDRFDYMDFINSNHFARYGGQRFAFDRTAMYVDEWEPNYFRPVYYPAYPSWTVCGNVYMDYPWGASVYIDGIYWGVTPLYVPRVYVGWHTFTVYDHYGYCWESDIHVTRFHTVVLDRSVVVTSPGVVSKTKSVRSAGYRNPAASGYPNYKVKQKEIAAAAGFTSTTVTGKTRLDKPAGSGATTTGSDFKLSKKYVRGSTEMVQTNRGFESAGAPIEVSKKGRSSSTGVTTSSKYRTSGGSSSGVTTSKRSFDTRTKSSSGSSTGNSSSVGTSKRGSSKSGDSGGSSSSYYQKKSGSSSSSSSKRSFQTTSRSSGTKSTGSSSGVKSSGSSKKSGSSSTTGSSKSKSSTPKSTGSSSKKGGSKR